MIRLNSRNHKYIKNKSEDWFMTKDKTLENMVEELLKSIENGKTF